METVTLPPPLQIAFGLELTPGAGMMFCRVPELRRGARAVGGAGQRLSGSRQFARWMGRASAAILARLAFRTAVMER